MSQSRWSAERPSRRPILVPSTAGERHPCGTLFYLWDWSHPQGPLQPSSCAVMCVCCNYFDPSGFVIMVGVSWAIQVTFSKSCQYVCHACISFYFQHLELLNMLWSRWSALHVTLCDRVWQGPTGNKHILQTAGGMWNLQLQGRMLADDSMVWLRMSQESRRNFSVECLL